MIGLHEFSIGIRPIFTAKLSMSFRGCKNTCQYKSTLLHNESVDFSTFDPKGYESTWESSNFIVMKIHLTTETCSRKYQNSRKQKCTPEPAGPLPSGRVNHRSTLARVFLWKEITACCNYLPDFPQVRSVLRCDRNLRGIHQLLCLFGG